MEIQHKSKIIEDLENKIKTNNYKELIEEYENKLSDSENEIILLRKNENCLRNKILKVESSMNQIKIENEFLLKKPIELLNFSNLDKITV